MRYFCSAYLEDEYNLFQAQRVNPFDYILASNNYRWMHTQSYQMQICLAGLEGSELVMRIFEHRNISHA